MAKALAAALGLFLTAGAAGAQSSASYTIERHAINGGGHPAEGAQPSSTSFRISADAVGEGALGAALSSPSFSMDGGFLPAYAPPGEVRQLLLADHDTLQWDAQPSALTYNLYRDALGALSSANAGTCEQAGISGTSAIDAGAPPSGDGWFYLVTARNRLGEEGTRGVDGDGTQRPETGICP